MYSSFHRLRFFFYRPDSPPRRGVLMYRMKFCVDPQASEKSNFVRVDRVLDVLPHCLELPKNPASQGSMELLDV